MAKMEFQKKRQLYVSQDNFEVEDFCYQFFNAHMKKRYNFVLPFDLEVSKLASMRQSREFPWPRGVA